VVLNHRLIFRRLGSEQRHVVACEVSVPISKFYV